MQSLPISIPTPAAVPVQAPNPSSPQADSNAAPIAEPFDRVLARQQAQDSSSQPAAKPVSAGEGQAVAVPDMVSTLPADMLAALLPATPIIKAAGANADSFNAKKDVLVDEKKMGAANEKPNAPTADGSAAPSADMLAALLPTGAIMQSAGAAAASKTQSIATEVPGVTSALGASRVLSNKGALGDARQAASQSQAALLQLRMQDTPKAGAPVADSSQASNAFAAVLGNSGRDAVSATQLERSATQMSVQAAPPDAATSLASLLQNSASPLAASQHVPLQAVVATPMTNDRWGDEFSQKITWLTTQQGQSAELHLNPPHLGPLDVVLNVSGDQATALFTSAHAAVREAVELALPKLREMLADNGIMLGNATVSDQSPKDQQTAGQQTSDRQRKSEGGLAAVNAVAGGISSGASLAPARRQQGMLDTFA